MTDVIWVSYKKPDIISRGYWDQGLLERLFDHTAWRPVQGETFTHWDGFDEWVEHSPTQGAVVVVPAQHHADEESVKQLNQDLSELVWCLLILTGDECSLFPYEEIRHPNIKIWVMTPRPDIHGNDRSLRFLGEGWHYDTPDVLAEIPVDFIPQNDWFFAGQVTHWRREELVEALKEFHIPGELIETPGFTQGLGRHEYLRTMRDSKVIPCPSGPGTPDSFRLYEALEAGCVPIADAFTPDVWEGYWSMMWDGDIPFRTIEEWSNVGIYIAASLMMWPEDAYTCHAWWQQKKREMAYWLRDDVCALREWASPPDGAKDVVTVLMPTSPTPNNPSTSIIEQTIASIREQPELRDCEIIVMIDGVREEQEFRKPAYQEYVRRLVHLCNRWHNVVPLVAHWHLHQGNLTKWALKFVKTDTVLFVEHDTPIIGEVPWGCLADVLTHENVNVIRLHHEANVLDVHQHLMLDTYPHDYMGVPLLRTAQWSQRPHLASTQFYRDMTDKYFGSDSRTMIEDVMHGVLDQAWRERKVDGWNDFRLFMYSPEGDIKRSTHLDGRQGDPKFDMIYAYDGDTPEGAPAPTAGRVD